MKNKNILIGTGLSGLGFYIGYSKKKKTQNN